MNMKLMPYLLFLIFCFTFEGQTLASSQQKQRWTSCYSRQKSKLYFKSHNDKRKTKQCSGSTVFTVPKEYKLIEMVKDNGSHFSTPIPGTKRILELNNGRRVLVSQWNNLSKSNTILILEPNLESKKVKKLCVFDNFSDAYSARFNSKTKKIEVLVNTPATLGGNDYRKIWKTCSI